MPYEEQPENDIENGMFYYLIIHDFLLFIYFIIFELYKYTTIRSKLSRIIDKIFKNIDEHAKWD